MDKFKNPKTGKMCNIGGKVHKTLVKEGIPNIPQLPEKEESLSKSVKNLKVSSEDNEEIPNDKMMLLAKKIALQHSEKFIGLTPLQCKEMIQSLVKNEVINNPKGIIAKEFLGLTDEIHSDSDTDIDIDDFTDGEYDEGDSREDLEEENEKKEE